MKIDNLYSTIELIYAIFIQLYNNFFTRNSIFFEYKVLHKVFFLFTYFSNLNQF
jgi:hypothetical protein